MSNYLTGNNPAGWTRGVPRFGRVRYSALYPGVDLVYHGGNTGLEYDVVVSPGGDLSRVVMEFAGQRSLAIDPTGDLVIDTTAGALVQHRPVAYQDAGGERHEVAAQFALVAPGRIGFRVGPYDHQASLVVDPVLDYSTYLGGNGTDRASGITVGSDGSMYVTGSTTSTNFPQQRQLGSTAGKSGDAVFVSKLSPDGGNLVYSTYIAGDSSDVANGIAVDAGGHAYIAGVTSSGNFPVTPNALISTNPPPSQSGQSQRIFVTELNQTGSALIYSTYFGAPVRAGNGLPGEYANGIALDSGGDAFIAGFMDTGGNPPGAPPNSQPCPPTATAGATAFVTRFHAISWTVDYSRFLGCDGVQVGSAIAVDPAGNAVVVGVTAGGHFPTVPPTPASNNPGQTGFVARLDPSGGLVYSRYLGGTDGDDQPNAVASSPAGEAYLTGYTTSSDYPLKNAFQTRGPTGSGSGVNGAGSRMAMVTKLTPGGQLAYSTYLGGSLATQFQDGNAIGIDGQGGAYIVGTTSAPDFPTQGDPHNLQPVFNPPGSNLNIQEDAFITALTPDGQALRYSTFLGGDDVDQAFAIAVVDTNRRGLVYLAGSTSSTNFPLHCPRAGGGSLLGNPNAFIAKVGPGGDPRLPYICGLSVHSGPVTGGTKVVITGGHFTGAISVSFDASRVLTQPCVQPGTGLAPCFTVDSDTQVTVYSPAVAIAGTVKTVDVRINSVIGDSVTTPADQFQYHGPGGPVPKPPAVQAIVPTCGPPAGGTSIGVTGSNFSPPLRVDFAFVGQPGSRPALVGPGPASGYLSVTSPPLPPGTTADIVVTTLGGSSPFTGADRFAAPCGSAIPTPSPTPSPTPAPEQGRTTSALLPDAPAGPHGLGVPGGPSGGGPLPPSAPPPPAGGAGPILVSAGDPVGMAAGLGQDVLAVPGAPPLREVRGEASPQGAGEHAMVARRPDCPWIEVGVWTMGLILGVACFVLRARRDASPQAAIARCH